MKTLPLVLALALISTSVFAAKKTMPDWYSPRDNFPVACGNAVIEKLMKDKEVSQYLEPGMSVSLEWNDDSKTEVAFNFNFGEDVRDGYMTGDIAVKLLKGGNCKVGKVGNASVGD